MNFRQKQIVFKCTILVILAALALACTIVYYTVPNNLDTKLDYVTRPSSRPPLPLPPLTTSKRLKPLTQPQIGGNLRTNFCAVPVGDKYLLHDVFDRPASEQLFANIQIFGNLALCKTVDTPNYNIYKLNVQSIEMLASDLSFDTLQILSNSVLKSNLGFHKLSQLVLGDLKPVEIANFNIVYFVNFDIVAIANSQLKLGLANLDGTIIYTPQFDFIQQFQDKITVATKGLALYSIDLLGNIVDLPHIDGFVPISYSDGIFWYQNADLQAALYDPNQTLISDNGGVLHIDRKLKSNYTRTFNRYLIVQSDEFALLYNFVDKTLTTVDQIDAIILETEVLFVFKLDDKYTLLDSKLDIVVSDMGSLQHDVNLLLSNDGVSQLFSLI